MSNKLSDLLDQLAEELPDNETVKAAQDEYSKLYDEEAAEGENDFDSDAPADDIGVDEGPKGFDDLMAEDSAEAPAEESENPMDAIFGKAKPKDDKAKAKKPNPFADL